MKDSTINVIIEVTNTALFLFLFYCFQRYCCTGNWLWLAVTLQPSFSLFRNNQEDPF